MRKKTTQMKTPKIPDYTARAIELAEDCLGRAYSLIQRFEDDGQFEEPISEEELISELNCIRDELDDCAEDGWTGYRDAMDALSNCLWKIGVAWPQYLPYWSWADVVTPKDLKDEISETCLYREDLLAIRKYSDNLKCRFKEAVHLLVEHARNTLEDFPKGTKRCQGKRSRQRKKSC